MPPLPPDTAEAAPALFVYTEDTRQTVRFAAPLGPLDPSDRPPPGANRPFPWTQPGALQGDDDPPPSGELETEVERDYPDVRLSKSSRPIPLDRRTENCVVFFATDTKRQ